MGTIFRSDPPRPQSSTRGHQAAPGDRSEAFTQLFPKSFIDSEKHTNTNSTTDCADPLRGNQLLRTPLPRKDALPPLPVLFLHPALRTSVRSTLISTSLERLLPTIKRHPSTCLLGPSIHLLDLHPRRMAKCLGSLINFLQLPTHRRLQNEKHFNRWKVICL